MGRDRRSNVADHNFAENMRLMEGERTYYFVNAAGQLQVCDLEQNFPFLQEDGHIVSLVGAGGKSTMLYLMAEKAASFGKKVLVTTTTHIMLPPEAVMAWNEEQVYELWANRTYAVIGERAEEKGKLCTPQQMFFKQMLSEADLVLIEADGAKRFPCKVPASHEPVILPECDIVVGIAGLSALLKPIGQNCFREADVLAFLNCYVKQDKDGAIRGQVCASDCLTPNELAVILSSEAGTAKYTAKRDYYVCLNQCDNEERLEFGVEIAGMLQKRGITQICLTGEKLEKE